MNADESPKHTLSVKARHKKSHIVSIIPLIRNVQNKQTHGVDSWLPGAGGGENGDGLLSGYRVSLRMVNVF